MASSGAAMRQQGPDLCRDGRRCFPAAPAGRSVELDGGGGGARTRDVQRDRPDNMSARQGDVIPLGSKIRPAQEDMSRLPPLEINAVKITERLLGPGHRTPDYASMSGT